MKTNARARRIGRGWWVLAVGLLAATTSVVVAPADAAEPAAPRLAIEQDGRAIVPADGTVTLRRAPFTIAVPLAPRGTALVSVALTPAGYDLARTGKPIDDMFLRGGGFAESDGNRDRTLYLRNGGEPGHHVWPFESLLKPHRFDSITMEAGQPVGRRVVNAFSRRRFPHALATWPVAHVYLVYRLVDASQRETGRTALKLTFDMTRPPLPVGAGAKAVATVNGQPISRDRYARAYARQLAFYRTPAGGGFDDLTLAEQLADQRVLNTLVKEEVTRLEARRRRVDATVADAWARLKTLSALQKDGRFVGEARAREILAAHDPSVPFEELLEGVRLNVVEDRLLEAVTKGVPEGVQQGQAYQAWLDEAARGAVVTVNHDAIADVVDRTR